MEDTCRYYVYEHWRTDKNVCFYVGKGNKYRGYAMWSRNAHHRAIQAKMGRTGHAVEVRIVASELNESDAFALEKERILFWRAAGANLANLTDGGDGPSNPAPEVRAKIAAALMGNKHTLGRKMTAEQKRDVSDRMKGNLYWLGKTLTAEHREKISRAQLGRVFSAEWRKKLSDSHKGRKPTRESLEKSAVTIRKNAAKRLEGADRSLVDSLGRKKTGPMANARPVVCVTDGNVFPSASEAAKFYECAGSSISALCNNDPRRKTAGGRVFKYIEQTA